MKDFIIEIMNSYGYIGIFFLIMIENIFPPIPSEVILTFGGFATISTNMTIFGVIIASTIGSVVGALILYGIGRILNANRLEKLISSKLGKALRFKEGDVHKAEDWFTKRGLKSVFFCRFIPIIRSLISIPAGISKVKFFPFLILTILGTFIWNTVLVFLGSIFGEAWEKISNVLDVYSKIALIAIGLIVVILGLIFIKKRFYGKEDQTEEKTDEKN